MVFERFKFAMFSSSSPCLLLSTKEFSVQGITISKLCTCPCLTGVALPRPVHSSKKFPLSNREITNLWGRDKVRGCGCQAKPSFRQNFSGFAMLYEYLLETLEYESPTHCMSILVQFLPAAQRLGLMLLWVQVHHNQKTFAFQP